MHQIIKQPDGKLAVWSTVVDDFVRFDASVDEIIEWEVETARKDIERRLYDIAAALDRGEKPYFRSTMTWDEAQTRRASRHGRPFDPALDGV